STANNGGRAHDGRVGQQREQRFVQQRRAGVDRRPRVERQQRHRERRLDLRVGRRLHSQATSSATTQGSAAFAGAAFSSSADTTTGIPTCSGGGLALGLRSDGHFCVDVLGNVVSG